MNQLDPPPIELDGAAVSWFASVDGLASTGACKHSVNGQPQVSFRGLAIASYGPAKGVYLFYCNASWSVENDTYHDSVDEAKQFAELQYPNVSDRWQEISNSKPKS